MDISDKKKFRIKVETYKDGFDNLKGKTYTLQICKRHFFRKKWEDYEFRLKTTWATSWGVHNFSSLESLDFFFKLYSENAIYYKDYPIYTYCPVSCVDDEGMPKIFYQTRFEIEGRDIEDIEREIDNYENVRKSRYSNITNTEYV